MHQERDICAMAAEGESDWQDLRCQASPLLALHQPADTSTHQLPCMEARHLDVALCVAQNNKNQVLVDQLSPGLTITTGYLYCEMPELTRNE